MRPRSERLVAGIARRRDLPRARSPTPLLPIFPVVLAAAVVHAAASCVLGPAIAAISLGLVGHAAIGERLGRNARFASIGNGACGRRDGRRAAISCPPRGGLLRHRRVC